MNPFLPSITRRAFNRGVFFMKQTYTTMTKTAQAKTPVELHGIDGTYATALYNAATKDRSLEKTEKLLGSLCNIIDKDESLSMTLKNPSLSFKDRLIVAEVLAKSLGNDKLILNFLKIIAEKNRFDLIKEISKKFLYLMNSEKGEVEVIITSASLLDSQSLSRLGSAISKSKHIGPGKKVKITTKINTSIIGGIIVEIGNYTIDLSVAHRILKLNKALTGKRYC
ncbi:hypothetical protein PORY_002762 [Pneumocystis oryctolagi]|uniref:Uncharacterized protein n=1 Tax=Pneumocystis oryctolagi TaxID=42067 RepID=A0ACB7CAB4_9ASCO|nr:hypothetical protein PORY_002762 [Pneumocystis oryctolagi]